MTMSSRLPAAGPSDWPVLPPCDTTMSMIRPSRARFLIDAHPEPLALSLPPPAEDLFALYRPTVLPDRPSFLLQSGKGGGAVARYSCLGRDPYLVLRGQA